MTMAGTTSIELHDVFFGSAGTRLEPRSSNSRRRFVIKMPGPDSFTGI
jgi:hypothetical protein